MEVFMLRKTSIIAVGFIAVASNGFAAQTKVDMAALTCAELSGLYVDEFVVAGAWMSGYYNAKRGNTSIDIKQLGENSKKVLAFCKANPKMTVMKAIEQLMSAKN
jgi:HdeA/HdeB family